jgi:hypothetical protein
MSDQSNVNRVEIDIGYWRSKEERLAELFSSSLSINKSLLKEKLLYYQHIAVKYKYTENTDERSALRILKNERKKIAQELYPNALVQLLHNLIYSVIIEKITARKIVKAEERSNHFLQDQLKKTGFQDVFGSVEHSLREGKNKFTLPASHYVNESEKVDYELNFVKNKEEGCQFEGYKATLYNELKPNESYQHYFKINMLNGFDKKQAYNLLSGRAVKKEESWVKFDLNDKDSSGNYRLKEFHSEFGYDLQKVIGGLPLKELSSNTETVKLLDALKDGSREPVIFLLNEIECKYYLDANPQFKSINIYDENLKKITLGRALELKTLEITRKQLKSNETPKNDVSKRRGMQM